MRLEAKMNETFNERYTWAHINFLLRARPDLEFKHPSLPHCLEIVWHPAFKSKSYKHLT